MSVGWDIGIDVGGTFVDVVAHGPGGLASAKHPRRGAAPAASVLQALQATTAQLGIGPDAVGRIVHGTTLATNILLERRAAPVAVVCSRGFADVLTLGRQSRRDLYRAAVGPQTPLDITPEALRFGIAGRLDAAGRLVEAPEEAEVRAVGRQLAASGVQSAAVCLLFGHLDGAIERQVAGWLAAAAPGLYVSLSHEVDPRPREYERWVTTVLDAYVKPGVAAYLDELRAGLAGLGYPEPLVMRSLGGVAPLAECLRVPSSLAMSGPAAAVAGVTGMLDADSARGAAVSMDIGGTTADLCLLREGQAATTLELAVSELGLRLRSLDVRSVAVGGGSLVRVDAAGGVRVGPASAGADPGPAAYGRGGRQATLTDCLVVLGLAPTRLAGGLELDAAAAREAVARDLATPLGTSPEAAAEAAVRVANAMLAEAVKEVAIDGGVDPRDATLIAAGGGGALHAAEVAALAGMSRVVVPPLPGVAAAVGLLTSPLVRLAEAALDLGLDDAGMAAVHTAAGALAVPGSAPAAYPGASAEYRVDMGYEGQGFTLEVPLLPNDTAADLHARFETVHGRLRGHGFAARPRVRGVRLLHARHPAGGAPAFALPAQTHRVTPRASATGMLEVDRAALAPDAHGSGPLRVLAQDTTLHIPEGWRWRAQAGGQLLLEAAAGADEAAARRATGDVDVLGLRLEGIAERMQLALVRSAVSSVAREGMDCAAALFLPDGRIVAQARSLPLLLGSMIPAVAGVLRAFPAASMAPDDAYLLNDPWSGGTHLPDLVMVRPVHVDGLVVALSAAILHHQDVGGTAPGSVPPDAPDIHHEGLRIPPVRWRDAEGVRADVSAILCANSRTPDNLLGDLDAQWAAISLGARDVAELAGALGPAPFAAGCEALIERAATLTRAALGALPDGEHRHVETLDTLPGGERVALHVAIRKHGEAVELDFTGSSPQVRAPLNAPPAAMLAAALFFMRTLAPEAPNNHGCLAPLTLRLPPGSVVNPALPAAVNARTATVKLACNALLAAWATADPARAVAPNAGVAVVLSVGGQRTDGSPFFHTEIIAGGAGGGPAGEGASGVSTDVGNARNLPVEMLEAQSPIRVERYTRRRGSGGAGRHPGGDGVVRAYRLLEGTATVSYRGERHETSAPGAAGGSAGQPSRAQLIRADGGEFAIDSKTRFTWQAGETLIIETAGAGGWGDAGAPAPITQSDAVWSPS